MQPARSTQRASRGDCVTAATAARAWCRTSMRAIGLVALAACAPSWIHDDFKPHAIAEARHAASARYSCPLPRVELRCDATWSVHATDGDLVVWEPDGSVGTIVASAPQWTFDLDVCGQTRRFAREMPEPHTPFAGFTEEYMPCQGGVCIDRAAGCRSVTAGPLWAVPLAAAPAGCDAAPIDRALAVRVDQSLVGVAVVAMFFNRLRFNERETFRHFGFARTPEEENAATQEGKKLLSKSPYKDQPGDTQFFLQALKERSTAIPNLVSPHLGNKVAASWTIPSTNTPAQPVAAKSSESIIAALPLGGRIHIEPWNNRLEMMKPNTSGPLAEDEKMPFEVTPFVIYLTRQIDATPARAVDAESLEPDTDPIAPAVP